MPKRSYAGHLGGVSHFARKASYLAARPPRSDKNRPAVMRVDLAAAEKKAEEMEEVFEGLKPEKPEPEPEPEPAKDVASLPGRKLGESLEEGNPEVEATEEVTDPASVVIKSAAADDRLLPPPPLPPPPQDK